jgi:DNA (cytosine-5)-methyltransferase 1
MRHQCPYIHHGDIHDVAAADIPNFDILCAGFPCQPFSLAGVSKKLSLGRKHGFEDEKQGNLFFDLAAIISFRQPPAFVLENGKHLHRHDDGRTFDIIYRTLTEELGYTAARYFRTGSIIICAKQKRRSLGLRRYLWQGSIKRRRWRGLQSPSRVGER